MARLSSIFLAIALAIAGVSATNGNCLSGTKTASNPSGNQVYDVSKYYCFTGEGNPAINTDQLCPKEASGYAEEACHGSCYDPNDYTCVNGQLKQPSQVPPGNSGKCGNVSFDPKSYHCFSGNFLCKIPTERCGNACYDPHQYSCPNGALSQTPED